MQRFLRILFGDDDAIAEDNGHDFPREQVAAAALMVEAARLDGSFDEAERRTVHELLRRQFGLPDDLAGELLAAAETAAEASADWHKFTRDLKEALTPPERVQIVELLWEVAYADGRLHDYEASLLRRVVGLLHVEDRESGEARLRVLARRGLTAI